MIISPGRNYIFVHIPKTGGTSLALALEGRARADDIMMGDTPKAVKRRKRLKDVRAAGRLWKHSTLADIDGLVAPEFVQGAFVFAMVRNPWDRMVSYYHWLGEQRFDHPAVQLARELEFDAFLRAPHTQRTLSNHPYADYMVDAAGVERASLYIRLEHFETDADPLWAHLGFRLELPHENASDRQGDYRPYYSDATAELVGSLCQRDITQFQYSF
jgi:hypothetical protein